MPSQKSKATRKPKVTVPKKAEGKAVSVSDVVRREYAGKYVAWAPNGLRIVAVASSFEVAERKAAKAGYPQVAVARIPKGRSIN